MNNNEVYQAGVARVDITPPVGIRLIGYAVREGMSKGVDEPLTLTVLALRGGGTTILLIAIDICLMYVPEADRFREQCAKAAGVASANVLVNFNHSHSVPATKGWMDFDTPEQVARQADFARMIMERGAEACRQAVASMRPARLSTSWGECHGNINRRQKSPDGTVLLGEDPNAPCDHSVGVIRVDELNGKPTAVAFRYSCHTVSLGPKSNVISPDFAGPARTVIESSLGCPALFLQGCAGNVNPASGIGQDAEGREDTVRLGQMLGAEVLKVAQGLRTHRRRSTPKLVRSVAVYWMFEYEAIVPGVEGKIRAKETRMELPLTPFPEIAEVEREREEYGAKLRAVQEKHEREWVINPVARFDYWATKRLAAARKGPNPLRVSFPVQVLEVGGVRIVALPFEPMTETGMALREAIGAETFVLGYCNGVVSYLPTPEISREGGMEAKLGYKSYLLESEIPGDWEPAIRQRVLEMCGKA